MSQGIAAGGFGMPYAAVPGSVSGSSTGAPTPTQNLPNDLVSQLIKVEQQDLNQLTQLTSTVAPKGAWMLKTWFDGVATTPGTKIGPINITGLPFNRILSNLSAG